jgi:hypothetical protein
LDKTKKFSREYGRINSMAQLMNTTLEQDVNCVQPRNMRVWNKPYVLPGGDAVYFGVSPVDEDSEQILVPFQGFAEMSFKNQWNPTGVPVDKVAVKYKGRPGEKVFETMNTMLDAVIDEIKNTPLESEVGQKLADSVLMNPVSNYPRRENTITAKFKVKDGVVQTNFIGITDFEAFKKRAMFFLGKKKPVPISGLFHVQGVVLSNRGLDVCVRLWELSIRK